MSTVLSEQALKDVEDGLSRAALNPALWPSSLERLVALLGGNGAALFSPHLAEGDAFGMTSGIGCETLPEYASIWAPEDPWFKVAGPEHFATAGVAEIGTSILSSRDLRATRFYADFARRHGLENVMSLKVCDQRDPFAPVTHLSIFRPPTSDNFSLVEVRALKRLWPAVQRGVQSYWLLRRASVAERIASAAFEAIQQPVWLLRSDGFIEYANPSACTALEQWKPSLVCACGRLANIGSTRVETLLARGAEGARHVTSLVGIELEGRVRKTRILLTRLPGGHELLGVWPRASWVLMLELTPKEFVASSGEWMQILQRQYGLTPAETRVLSLVGSGRSPAEIADELELRLPTVRSHLAAVFAKTGARRQAELVRIVMG